MNSMELNPYVGPRPFQKQDRKWFFGREQEADELRARTISKRLLLFHGKSGVGKTSLIQTSLIPELEANNFEVLPIGRISGMVLPSILPRNIYIYNLILHLNQGNRDLDYFKEMSLSQFLNYLVKGENEKLEKLYYYDEAVVPSEILPRTLIIDQFEELLTKYPESWQQREDFFNQLHQAMEDDPYLGVLISIREDYVGQLDKYAHLIPGKFRDRYHMERMSREAAKRAIMQPAQKAGCPFEQETADRLVLNFSYIKTSDYGKHNENIPGPYIEPVQLQVVCQHIWDSLKNKQPTSIKVDDLRALSEGKTLKQFVDDSLGMFYEQAIKQVLDNSNFNISEMQLREWFERRLITETQTRGMVHKGDTTTAGIDNSVVEYLTNSLFLLREETRSGGTWYELIHDRFIEPIRQANRHWQDRQPLIQLARQWVDSGRSQTLLLTGQPLTDALDAKLHALGPQVQEFLAESQNSQRVRREHELQAQKELNDKLSSANEKLQNQRIKLLVLTLLAIGLAFIAVIFGLSAKTESEKSAAAESTAVAQSTNAVKSQFTAEAESTSAAIARETLAANYEARLAEATAAANLTVTAIFNSMTEAGATSSPTLEATRWLNEVTPTQYFTPDIAGTATVYALQTVDAQLAEVRATQTFAAATAESPNIALSTPYLVSPSPSLPLDQIAFVQVQPRLGILYGLTVIDASGKYINFLPDYASSPTWSPKDTKLAFIGETGINNLGGIYGQQGPGIWIIDEDGNNPKQLLKSDDVQYLAWSPDQLKIAFEIASGDKNNQVRIIDSRDGSHISQFVGEQPAWRPDSQKLAVKKCSQTSDCGLWLVNIDGGEPVQLTNFASDAYPAWSSDSRYIVFSSNARDGNWEIYLLDLNNNQINRVTNHPQTDINPIFSRDDQEIYFRTDFGGEWRLMAIQLNGENERLVKEAIGDNADWDKTRLSVR